MRLVRRKKHISWILILALWIVAVATVDHGWFGFILAGIVTVLKLAGEWSDLN